MKPRKILRPILQQIIKFLHNPLAKLQMLPPLFDYTPRRETDMIPKTDTGPFSIYHIWPFVPLQRLQLGRISRAIHPTCRANRVVFLSNRSNRQICTGLR